MEICCRANGKPLISRLNTLKCALIIVSGTSRKGVRRIVQKRCLYKDYGSQPRTPEENLGPEKGRTDG